MRRPTTFSRLSQSSRTTQGVRLPSPVPMCRSSGCAIRLCPRGRADAALSSSSSRCPRRQGLMLGAGVAQ
eukprot:15450357-Alexandrium_andersonii.AAC.1